MIKKSTFLVSALLFSSFVSQANAQESGIWNGWSLAGTAGLTSDYVFRGFSQTDEKPAVQTSVTLTNENGFSASLWGSNVDFNDGDEAQVEIDATLSYAFDAGPLNWTVGGIYYAYPGADSDLDYDYVEAFIGASHSFENIADLSVQAFYSPDYFAGSGNSFYTTAGVTVPLHFIDNLNAVGSVGYQWIDDEAAFGARDYADWSAGLAYTYQKANLSLKYYDTSISGNNCNDLCDSRVVAAIGVSF